MCNRFKHIHFFENLQPILTSFDLFFSIMRNYFHLADTSNDKNINKNEVTAFLDSINIKLKKDQLKKLIKVILIIQSI